MTDSGKDRFPARSGKLDLPRAAPDGEGEAITGIPFSRGALFHMLRNRTYLGMINRLSDFPGPPHYLRNSGYAST